MNTPYRRTYNEKGEVEFPKEGIVNHHPSNRGNRFNPRKMSNRKVTEGRLKTRQYISNVIKEVKVSIYHPHPNMTTGTWIKPIIRHKSIVHHS